MVLTFVCGYKKAIKQYFLVLLFIALYKVVRTFCYVEELCDHSPGANYQLFLMLKGGSGMFIYSRSV